MGLNAESCVVQQKGSNQRSGGGECVVSPVCFATNTKANQEFRIQNIKLGSQSTSPSQYFWSSLLFMLKLFFTNRRNNTFAASPPLV